MKLHFPSRGFDAAVAAVCHGSATIEEIQALNALLRSDPPAFDEYILRLELHAHLASESELFAPAAPRVAEPGAAVSPAPVRDSARKTRCIALAVAAALFFAAFSAWRWWLPQPDPGVTAVSMAVAMLQQTVDAQWESQDAAPRLGAPLEPGSLKLRSGLAQVVFYSGARLVMEGPAELELLSANRAFLRQGKATVEVPAHARGFRIATPHGAAAELDGSFGFEIGSHGMELHVFAGSTKLHPTGQADNGPMILRQGAAARVRDSQMPLPIDADPAAFGSHAQMEAKFLAAEALRFDRWQTTSTLLNQDKSMVLRLDFESRGSSPWQLRNLAGHGNTSEDASIVGCQWTNGRWAEKRALEFQGVSDRVRMTVPGDFAAITLSAWVKVHGLDRKINSLFMCDGFEPGTLHWLIRNDGVLGLTVIGDRPANHQIIKSAPVITLDRYGAWLHLATVIDGRKGSVAHYVNGRLAGDSALRIKSPYRFGTAEIGNWNSKGFPSDNPFMIRNFSGAIDELCLFGRALDAREIHALYSDGQPEPEPVAFQE